MLVFRLDLSKIQILIIGIKRLFGNDAATLITTVKNSHNKEQQTTALDKFEEKLGSLSIYLKRELKTIEADIKEIEVDIDKRLILLVSQVQQLAEEVYDLKNFPDKTNNYLDEHLLKARVVTESTSNYNPKQQLKQMTRQEVAIVKNKYQYNDAYVKQLKSTSGCRNLHWESNSVYRYEQSRNEPIFLCAISNGDHAFIALEMEGYPNFYHLHPRNKLVINNLGSSLDIFRFFFDFDEDTPASLPKYICHSWEPAVIEHREDNLFELYKKGKLLLGSGAKQ